MGELQSGDVIDKKYRIVKLIGEGGMGAVYEGENVKIRRRVAIKTLLSGVASNPDVVGRFEREATAAGRIGNHHILEVLDLGEMADGDRYMVMEFLDGEPLASRIENRGRLTPSEVAPIALQVLEGLSAAHTAGIVHRDLKPDNVFLLRDHVGIKDFVKIIDFGISKFQALSGDGEQMAMTRTGAVMGTPYYMSPEQASGSRDADARTDLYALGVILYQAVSGRVPFDAPTFNQLMFKIVLSEPPPVTSVVPDVDPGFASIISKAMARDVDARFQNAPAFKAAIEAWRSTGAAVSVPPPPDRASMEAAVLSDGKAKKIDPKGGTAGSWSTSGVGAPADAARPAIPIIVGLSIAAALVLGVVGFGAYRLLGSSPSDATATAASADTRVAPAAVSPAPKSPAETEAAVLADKVEPEAKSTQKPAVVPSEAEAPVASAAQAPAPTSAQPKSSARAPSVRPVGKPVAAPAKPAAKRPSNDDDFGY